MSNLPKIDLLKVTQRNNQKLAAQLTDSTFRETHLEILAETLRDERDKAIAELEELRQNLGEK